MNKKILIQNMIRYDQQVPKEYYDHFSLKPKISIIIPSYNQGEYLERAVKSIINQNYPNTELILIDGGSNDSTVEVIEKYKNHFTYWVSESDTGQSNAINKGFQKASGDFFAWLNSDDCYYDLAFYNLLKQINKHPFYDFFYGDGLNIDTDDNVLQYWRSNPVFDRYLRFGGLIASHSAFWSRKVHKPLSEELNCNVDGELWIRMLPNTKKKHVPYPIGCYREQPESKSSNEKWKIKWKEDDDFIEKKYGPPPGPRSLRAYEFRLAKKIFHFTKRLAFYD